MKNKEVRALQIKGQNIEGGRMASELHDNLNTKIASVRYRLEAEAENTNDEVGKFINDISMLMNDIYKDVMQFHRTRFKKYLN